MDLEASIISLIIALPNFSISVGGFAVFVVVLLEAVVSRVVVVNTVGVLEVAVVVSGVADVVVEMVVGGNPVMLRSETSSLATSLLS